MEKAKTRVLVFMGALVVVVVLFMVIMNMRPSATTTSTKGKVKDENQPPITEKEKKKEKKDKTPQTVEKYKIYIDGMDSNNEGTIALDTGKGPRLEYTYRFVNNDREEYFSMGGLLEKLESLINKHKEGKTKRIVIKIIALNPSILGVSRDLTAYLRELGFQEGEYDFEGQLFRGSYIWEREKAS